MKPALTQHGLLVLVLACASPHLGPAEGILRAPTPRSSCSSPLPFAKKVAFCGGGARWNNKKKKKKQAAFAPLALPLGPLAGYYGVMLAPVYGKGLLPGTGGLLDLDTLEPRATPNEYLGAPVDECPRFQAGEGKRGAVKDYALSRADLRAAFMKVVDDQFLIKAFARPTLSDADRDQYVFVQRTLYFRFPDVINVRFIDRPNGKASLVIHSGSVFGAGDLGKNKQRVGEWLAALDKEVATRGGGFETAASRSDGGDQRSAASPPARASETGAAADGTPSPRPEDGPDGSSEPSIESEGP